MTNKNQELIVVGKFGRVQGLDGFIRVVSFTEPKENILNYLPWHIKVNNGMQISKPIAIKKSAKFDLVKIAGFEDRDQAHALTNTEISIEKSLLPQLQDDEYYWHDIIGMSVINTENIILGKVEDIIATGSNDVLVVNGGKRHLIPYINDYVINIDKEKNLITTNWNEDF